MKKALFTILLLTILPAFADKKCDHYIDEIDSKTPEESLFLFRGTINYSRVYVKVPFLEEQKPGIYIYIGNSNAEVNAFGYISKNSETIQIYKEPNIGHGEIEPFSRCIDKHVNANKDYFIKTCLIEKKLYRKDVFEQLASFTKKRYENMTNYCDCGQTLFVSIAHIMENRSVRMKEFHNLSCLGEDFDMDVSIRELRVIETLVTELMEPDEKKCNWRNLVPNPQKFAAEKFSSDDYELLLTEKDCPAL